MLVADEPISTIANMTTVTSGQEVREDCVIVMSSCSNGRDQVIRPVGGISPTRTAPTDR
jgi:hypothetical protein